MGRRRSLTFAAAGGLLGLLVLASPVGAGSSARVGNGEAYYRYHFNPVTANVNVGGTVTWANGSDAPHTVTSDAGSELASPTIGAGKTYRHTFAATGTFAYHCSIHRYMVGKVVVLAAGVNPPPTDTLSPSSPGTRDPGIPLAFVVLTGLGGALVGLRRIRTAA
jgi:plastocyanin